MHPLAAELEQKLYERTANICVIGLGYVGLPLACAFAAQGFTVTGYDVDPKKSELLNAGKNYIGGNMPEEQITALVKDGKLRATYAPDILARQDVIQICVPTPLTPQHQPDMSYVIKTTRTVAQYARPGQLIILVSTTYPGTTVEEVKPILEEGGLVSGETVFIGYAPEREDPGNTRFDVSTTPKIVSGEGEDALTLMKALYQTITAEVVPVSSTQTAEAAKLTENIFRAVNIALVNELKVIYDRMDIDVWEVINAAATKPFGFMPFYPGPGLGGHCIPIDPFYLSWKARERSLYTRFIELAGEINTRMPGYVVLRTIEALNQRFGKAMKGARLLLIGMAYKKNVSDVRESPGFDLMQRFEQHGAVVDYYDPHVPLLPQTREHPTLASRASVVWEDLATNAYDVAVISTDHDAVDYAALVDTVPLIIDSRNACAKRGMALDRVVKA